ncbi:uncharacterized protein CXorf65 homolog [Argopecten irradians]|uniref:uncharacterized protein CXorf65 homolog n=1 Tax=Argopecten irradians TaxID=31199 RepID=UPI00371CBB94
MFVTVKYGDQQSRIFNANCRNEVLLHHIKRRCECVEREDIVELSDEKGVVKNLRNFPFDYGSEYLKERETLILLKVDNLPEDQDCDRMVYVPLLIELEHNKEFTDALNPKQEVRPTSSMDDDGRGNKKNVKGSSAASKGAKKGTDSKRTSAKSPRR